MIYFLSYKRLQISESDDSIYAHVVCGYVCVCVCMHAYVYMYMHRETSRKNFAKILARIIYEW